MPFDEPRHSENEPESGEREGQAPAFHPITSKKIDARHDGNEECGNEQPMKPKHLTTVAEDGLEQQPKSPALSKARPQDLEIHCPNGEDPLEQLSRQTIGPRVPAAMTNGVISKSLLKTDLDLTATRLALREAADRIKAGDLSDAESMLYSQATSLNLLFAEMTRRAMENFNGDGRYFEAAKGYMGIALKAQAQCSRTLETLGSLKNPQTIFAKQANINNGGQQQVNNGSSPARTAKQEYPPNKLLEQSDEPRMDGPAQSEAGDGNSALETVGEGHRT